MAYYDLIWTDDNEDHVGQHGITFSEFAEVVENPDIVEDPHRPERHKNRIAFWGWTSTGKYIIAVIEVLDDGISALPVTAYETKES